MSKVEEFQQRVAAATGAREDRKMSVDGALPDGWTEAAPGGMATNPDPLKGGIVDREIVSGKWFVVFNRDELATLEGFATRQSAFAAFDAAMPQHAADRKLQKAGFVEELARAFPGFIDSDEVNGGDLVEWMNDHLDEFKAELGDQLFDKFCSEFPGFMRDEQVDGASLVDWMNENFDWGKPAVPDEPYERPQVSHRTWRTEPDRLTLAYVAIGAHSAVRAAGDVTIALDRLEGELGLIRAVSDQALMLDGVADWFDAREGNPGVFSYEVAEPFGNAYANALLSQSDELDAAKILRQVMLSAAYGPGEVEEAFASEMAARVDRKSATIESPKVGEVATRRPDNDRSAYLSIDLRDIREWRDRKMPDSQVALTEMQETAMRHKLMAFGVETFQRDAKFAGPQPGMKWHFTGCGQSSYDSEQAAFRAACEVVGVTPDAALRWLNGGAENALSGNVTQTRQRPTDADQAVTTLRDASKALLDAYGGNVPDWLSSEYANLESAILAVDGVDMTGDAIAHESARPRMRV